MLKKLFVFAILALVVGMTVPSTRAALAEKARPYVDGFKAKLVPSRLEAMASQLTARANRGEGFPTNFEGWLRRDFAASAMDPWGNLYFFESRRRGFLVGSLGPDGRRGTEDDITYEQVMQ
ncbi:MAG TPA: type II secretion system protein GspG [Longimicrobiales bacterium]|nr:type II secretion system protein GspG [Longimicrobiales bacterium]